MSKHSIDVQLLINDVEGDFLDSDHMKRFNYLLDTFMSEILVSQPDLMEHIYDFYFYYIISSTVPTEYLENATMERLTEIINTSQEEIFPDQNDVLMNEVAIDVLQGKQISLSVHDLYDDDFSQILENALLLNHDDLNLAHEKMLDLIRIREVCTQENLFPILGNHNYLDLSR